MNLLKRWFQKLDHAILSHYARYNVINYEHLRESDEQFITQQIGFLEREIARLRVREEETVFSRSIIPEGEEGNPYFKSVDEEDLDRIFKDHAGVYTFFLKRSREYQRNLKPETFARYHQVFGQFEEELRRLDPDWPDLTCAPPAN